MVGYLLLQLKSPFLQNSGSARAKKGKNLCKAALIIFSLRAQSSSAAKYVGIDLKKKKKKDVISTNFSILSLITVNRNKVLVFK